MVLGKLSVQFQGFKACGRQISGMGFVEPRATPGQERHEVAGAKKISPATSCMRGCAGWPVRSPSPHHGEDKSRLGTILRIISMYKESLSLSLYIYLYLHHPSRHPRSCEAGFPEASPRTPGRVCRNSSLALGKSRADSRSFVFRWAVGRRPCCSFSFVFTFWQLSFF